MELIGEKEQWGKVYGTEAVRLMVEYAKKMGSEAVYLTVDCKNERAQKAYKKCGFEVVKLREKKGEGEEFLMRV